MDKLKAWLKDGRGRVTQLATSCGVTHSAVLQWKEVPPIHAATVERVTGIPKEELRPDVFRTEQPAVEGKAA